MNKLGFGFLRLPRLEENDPAAGGTPHRKGADPAGAGSRHHPEEHRHCLYRMQLLRAQLSPKDRHPQIFFGV